MRLFNTFQSGSGGRFYDLEQYAYFRKVAYGIRTYFVRYAH